MAGESPSLAPIAQVTADLRQWIERSRTNSVTGQARLQEYARLRALLECGETFIKNVPPRAARSPETARDLDAYSAVLRDLEALIIRLEISLRLRRSQIEGAQFRLTATSAFATRVLQLE